MDFTIEIPNRNLCKKGKILYTYNFSDKPFFVKVLKTSLNNLTVRNLYWYELWYMHFKIEFRDAYPFLFI